MNIFDPENMRLTQAEISVLRDSLKQTGPSARLYLFSSQLDDAKNGDDIVHEYISEDIKGLFVDVLNKTPTLLANMHATIDYCGRYDKQQVSNDEIQ